MKFKPKHALAALAMTLAGQAGAQVLHDLPATGNPSLFFATLDEAAGRSYFSELVANAGSTTTGVLHMDELISNPAGTWTITLSGLNTFAAGSTTALADIFGGFGAAENNSTIGGGTTTQTGSRRLLMSVAQGSAAPALNNSQVNGASTNVTNFASQMAGQCTTSPCIATNPTQAGYVGIANGTAGIGLQWGFPSGPSMGDSLAGTIAWDIYTAATNSLSISNPAAVTLLALHAVLDLATNTLTITGPNAVPIPAAVWLLGSAMLGLVGIGRRKKGALGDNGLVAA